MNRLIACILLAGLLTACDAGNDGTQDPSQIVLPREEAPAAAREAARPKPEPAPAGQKGVDVLAQAGIEFAFPHAINYDIFDQSRSGTPRHRVLVEVIGGDFATVAEQFGQSLVDKGYALAKDGGTGGRIERTYTREDAPTYYLLMQPVAIGPKLARPDATGSIHIMWNRR